MKKNIGSFDRVSRIVFALIAALVYITNQISGTTAIIIGLFATILLLTGFVGFCPVYVPLKISTRKESKNNL